MFGAPKVKSMNVAESEMRPVLGPAGNKAASFLLARKPGSKPSKGGGGRTAEEEKKKKSSPSQLNHVKNVPSILRKSDLLFHLSLDASCSSDASTESLHSRGSTGRLTRSFSTSSARPRSSSAARQRKQCIPKPEKVGSDSDSVLPADNLQIKKRCCWVTPNTDPCYATFHDKEWGVPVHDDKKLFELLVLSGALAEHTWPTILSKRHLFREVFADFDPIAISKLNEKKIIAPGSIANLLLSELKLRAVIDNARQISKIIDEFGSFNNYIWSFVNYKPIVSKFRYPRQVPVKTPKADVISKDLVRRGFRSVGPTVIYSFMQVAGITNDHVISCFRFQECLAAATGNKQDDEKATTEEKKLMQVDEITNDHVYCFKLQECLAVVGGNREDNGKSKTEETKTEDVMDLGIAKVIDELSIMDNLTHTPESRICCQEEKGLVWQVK